MNDVKLDNRAAGETRHGEEFRDDQRRARRLPANVLNDLTVLSTPRSLVAVGQTVAALAVAIAAAVTWWTPWVVVPAIVVIASRQQALFVLAHDAAHYRLLPHRGLNDVLGRVLASIVGLSMCTYRVVHRLHHNHLYEARDPDIPLHGGYPRGRGYLLRKLLKDLCGVTAPKTYAYFFGTPAINSRASAGKDSPSNGGSAVSRPLDDTSPALRRAARRDRWMVVAVQVAIVIACFATGHGVHYLVLWVLPAFTVLQALLRLRAVCEHGAVTDFSSPLTAARTNFAPWWIRWLLFPHHVNYHVEHHLYPAVPHYRLPDCHRELARHGLLERAEVRHLHETLRVIAA